MTILKCGINTIKSIPNVVAIVFNIVNTAVETGTNVLEATNRRDFKIRGGCYINNVRVANEGQFFQVGGGRE